MTTLLLAFNDGHVVEVRAKGTRPLDLLPVVQREAARRHAETGSVLVRWQRG